MTIPIFQALKSPVQEYTMPAVSADTTIRQYQDFIREVYGMPNERHFDVWDMLSNVQRFAMRGLKGIRKGDHEKTRLNLLISMSWFLSLLNRLHIDLEDVVWKRFPHLCSYCASCPCICRKNKIQARQPVPVDDAKRPVRLSDFQAMFESIYPPRSRTLEHAGVHLAEELGEFSEAILAYKGEHMEEHFRDVVQEAADVFSCMVGVFNSLGISISGELSGMFSNNCHTCGKAPCECDFNSIVKFSS